MNNLLKAFGMLILCGTAFGQEQKLFLSKYKDDIQKYIMTGHEQGWKHCDILSANPSDEGIPQIAMALDKLSTSDIMLALEKSQCLLVKYDVTNKASLSILMDFGQMAISKLRLALVIKLHSDVNLEMATNTSNLPFLVAIEPDHGKEKFLCPVVGKFKPLLDDKMCSVSLNDYKSKALRIVLMGPPPDFVFTSTGLMDGANMRLIKMMAERMKFTPEISIASSFQSAFNQVKGKQKIWIIAKNKPVQLFSDCQSEN